MWLIDAMIVNHCFNSTDPYAGLALSSESAAQKLYMADTGLLVSLAVRDNEYLDNELGSFGSLGCFGCFGCFDSRYDLYNFICAS
jgi:hypothetical protein